MSGLTPQQAKELLNTQLNAEETKDFREISSSTNKIIERIPLLATPFTMIRGENGMCFGVMKNYKITDDFITIPELEEYLLKVSWPLIIKVTGIIVEDMIEAEILKWKKLEN